MLCLFVFSFNLIFLSHFRNSPFFFFFAFLYLQPQRTLSQRQRNRYRNRRSEQYHVDTPIIVLETYNNTVEKKRRVLDCFFFPQM